MKVNEHQLAKFVNDVKKAKNLNQDVESLDLLQAKSIHDSNENRWIRIDELSKLTSLSKSCINLWVAQGKLIPPLALSHTIKVWRLGDVISWFNDQKGSSK